MNCVSFDVVKIGCLILWRLIISHYWLKPTTQPCLVFKSCFLNILSLFILAKSAVNFLIHVSILMAINRLDRRKQRNGEQYSITTLYLREKTLKIIWRHIDPKSNLIVDRKILSISLFLSRKSKRPFSKRPSNQMTYTFGF